MVNGTIALPIMVAYAATQRMSWKKTGTLLLLTLVFIPIYFLNFQSPIRTHAGTDMAVQNLINIFQHLLAYLGSPFYHFLPGSHALMFAQIFGIIFLALSSIAAIKLLRHPTENSLPLFLLAFIGYIAGSALATAIGRSMLGVEQATTSRYTTPALMAWVSLLIIYSSIIIRSLAQWQHRIVWPMMMVMLVMAPFQVKAVKSHQNVNFPRELAVLAMEIGVRDLKQIAVTYWEPWDAARLANKPSERNLSIFGTPPFKDIRQLIGQDAGPLPDIECNGFIKEISTIDGVKIDFENNWVHLRKSNTEPIIRIYTEAATQEKADALALRIIEEIKAVAGI